MEFCGEAVGSGEYDLALLCHSGRSGVSRGGRGAPKERRERESFKGYPCYPVDMTQTADIKLST